MKQCPKCAAPLAHRHESGGLSIMDYACRTWQAGDYIKQSETCRVTELEDEIDMLQKLNAQLAERVAGQSELLGKKAEKVISELDIPELQGRRCPTCQSLMVHTRLAGYRCPRGCQ